MAESEPFQANPSAPRPPTASAHAGHNSGHHGGTILVIIGILKLFKGLLMLTIGLMALHLVHKDLAAYVSSWAEYLHMDPNGKWVNRLLTHVFLLSPKKLIELGVGAFIYSGLFFTEGVGLVLRKHWAEYFTTIMTALFIPLEIYEIFKRIHAHNHIAAPIYLTAINIAIVVYLIVRLRREARVRRLRIRGFAVTR